MTRPLPEWIGGFHVTELLGEGGMGRVYKAVEVEMFGRLVAVKVILEHLTHDSGAKARFLHEIETAAGLNHTNIVIIHTRGEHQGQLYFVMEYLDGIDLARFMREQPPAIEAKAIEERLGIAMQVCDALGYAHQRKPDPVIHRDIKPSNIMIMRVGDRPLVKLVDFGIAKQGDKGLTTTGVQPGTRRYMAPELLEGDLPSPRSDLFSLGLVLYELFTGEHPFGGKSDPVIESKILRDTPVPAAEKNPRLPAQVALLIDGLLQRKPGARPESAALVSQEIQEILLELRNKTHGQKRGISELHRGAKQASDLIEAGEAQQAIDSIRDLNERLNALEGVIEDPSELKHLRELLKSLELRAIGVRDARDRLKEIERALDGLKGARDGERESVARALADCATLEARLDEMLRGGGAPRDATDVRERAGKIRQQLAERLDQLEDIKKKHAQGEVEQARQARVQGALESVKQILREIAGLEPQRVVEADRIAEALDRARAILSAAVARDGRDSRLDEAINDVERRHEENAPFVDDAPSQRQLAVLRLNLAEARRLQKIGRYGASRKRLAAVGAGCRGHERESAFRELLQDSTKMLAEVDAGSRRRRRWLLATGATLVTALVVWKLVGLIKGRSAEQESKAVLAEIAILLEKATLEDSTPRQPRHAILQAIKFAEEAGRYLQTGRSAHPDLTDELEPLSATQEKYLSEFKAELSRFDDDARSKLNTVSGLLYGLERDATRMPTASNDPFVSTCKNQLQSVRNYDPTFDGLAQLEARLKKLLETPPAHDETARKQQVFTQAADLLKTAERRLDGGDIAGTESTLGSFEGNRGDIGREWPNDPQLLNLDNVRRTLEQRLRVAKTGEAERKRQVFTKAADLLKTAERRLDGGDITGTESTLGSFDAARSAIGREWPNDPQLLNLDNVRRTLEQRLRVPKTGEAERKRQEFTKAADLLKTAERRLNGGDITGTESTLGSFDAARSAIGREWPNDPQLLNLDNVRKTLEQRLRVPKTDPTNEIHRTLRSAEGVTIDSISSAEEATSLFAKAQDLLAGAGAIVRAEDFRDRIQAGLLDSGVRHALYAWKTGMEHRDAGAVLAVDRSVPEAALRDLFKDKKSISIDIKSIEIRAGTSAMDATAAVTYRYEHVDYNNRRSREDAVTLTFSLRREDERWMIVKKVLGAS